MEHVLKIFPNLSDLAKELSLPYPTVAAWKQRGRIPASYDLDIIRAAAKRGADLTLSQLAECRCRRQVKGMAV
ncbi:hypothetical protein [Sinirhodobacter hungdaonensis]|uniref:Uncharacterized protein n=1 Tax=Paenirhodobacter huangdaonensis TaxID=2501515 RepID=A0A443M0D0_9RHOB|nr:hypothetical protein EOW66_02220 [Sinirhodobacter huangdaonensis]